MTNAEIMSWLHWHADHAPMIWGLLGGTVVMAKVLRHVRRREERSPDAQWATVKGLRAAKLDGSTGVVLGRYRRYLLRYHGEGHMIIIAPPRTGKTSSVCVPTLLEPQPHVSLLVNDPKGELYRMTHRYQRSLGRRVYRLDATSLDSDHYNPWDAVRLGTPQEPGDLRVLARLITNPDGQTYRDANVQHWEDLTAQVAQACILFGLLTGRAAHPAGLYDLLGDLVLGDLLVDMEGTYHHALVTTARLLKDMTDNQVKSIMAGLRKNLHIYSDELVARMTSMSDFAPADLRTGKEPCTVYLTVPFGQDDLLNVNRVLMRQWLGAAMQQNPTPSTTRQTMHGWDDDLLVLLDEVQSLKRLDLLPDAINYGAGFGVRLVLITPSLKSLDELYGAHNFLESTAVQAYFGVTETKIAEHISRRLGVETVTQERVTKGRGGRSVTRESARKPLIDQSGVIHLADDQVIVTTREGKLQMVVTQTPWYRYEPWKRRGDSLQ